MPKRRLPSVIFLLAFITSLTLANPADSVFPQIQIKVKQNVYALEYANTFELRSQGLMQMAKSLISKLCSPTTYLPQLHRNRCYMLGK